MEKPTINVVFIGHADAGKSTAAGQLICKCGRLKEKRVHEFKIEAEKIQKVSLKYAGVFDQPVAERELGISMGISHEFFESSKYKFNIIDTPGHREFIKEMITGTSQADVGLLVVDSSEGRYEMGIDHNGQTREHSLLAYALGVKQLIVVMNKMDDKTVNFSEDRWKTIKREIVSHLKKVGYKPMKIPFIPISSRLGDNFTSKSIHMPWYGGPTLLEALDNVATPKRLIDKPLRVPIQDVRNVKGIGAILVGRVETGELKHGTSVRLAPSGTFGIVESLQINFQTVAKAIPGDIVSINIKEKWNVLKNIRPGYVLSNCNDHAAQEVSSFEAQIVIMDHPGKISNGYTPIIDCHTSHTPCTFLNIKEKLDQRTGKILVHNPKSVQAGDVCIVKLEPKAPLCIERFKDFPSLGRFAVRDSGRTVAIGVVKTKIHADTVEGV